MYGRGRYGRGGRSHAASDDGPPLDPETTTFLERLHHIWTVWKKNEVFYNMMHDRLYRSTNPYMDSLLITSKCPDFGLSKRLTLAFAVMETFENWLKDHTHLETQCLNEDVKLKACKILPLTNFCDLNTLILKVCKLDQDPDRMMTVIDFQLEKKNYKEACQLANSLQMYEQFSVEAFIVPLILQDRLNVAEDFLDQSQKLKEQLVSLLDELLGHQNINNQMFLLAERLKVPKVKQEKLQYKPLKKLLSRLVKKFNVPVEMVPNLNKKQKGGGLHYMLQQRFKYNAIGDESWREMAHEAVKDSPELQLNLVQDVRSYASHKEAAYWARRYQLPLDILPWDVKEFLETEQDSEIVDYTPQEDWDAPGGDSTGKNDPSAQYHSLNLPASSIIMVDNPQSLHFFTHEALKGVQLIGMDAEWKPYFGGQPTELALLQIAVREQVFLLDIVRLKEQVTPNQWGEVGEALFLNDSVVKLGFGMKTDLKAIESTLPHIGHDLTGEACNYLDLQHLWQKILLDHHFVFPFPADDERANGEGLTNLVFLCLGKPLNKDNQFSNWERRPLREKQVLYAALDAYCLLEVHTVLKNCCAEQNIPFHDTCKHLYRKPRHHKSHSPRQASRSSGSKKPHTEPESSSVSNHPPISARDARLVCDTMVQGLGKKLRQIGIDTHILEGGMDHSHCARVAHRERRFIVTRGSAFSELKYEVPEGNIYQVRSDQIEVQVEEVIKFFNIVVNKQDLFTRCQNCNCGDFLEISNSQLRHGNVVTRSGAPAQVRNIPPQVLSRYHKFLVCEHCGKCYWEGSHMQRWLQGKVGKKMVPRH